MTGAQKRNKGRSKEWAASDAWLGAGSLFYQQNRDVRQAPSVFFRILRNQDENRSSKIPRKKEEMSIRDDDEARFHSFSNISAARHCAHLAPLNFGFVDVVDGGLLAGRWRSTYRSIP